MKYRIYEEEKDKPKNRFEALEIHSKEERDPFVLSVREIYDAISEFGIVKFFKMQGALLTKEDKEKIIEFLGGEHKKKPRPYIMDITHPIPAIVPVSTPPIDQMVPADPNVVPITPSGYTSNNPDTYAIIYNKTVSNDQLLTWTTTTTSQSS